MDIAIVSDTNIDSLFRSTRLYLHATQVYAAVRAAGGVCIAGSICHLSSIIYHPLYLVYLVERKDGKSLFLHDDAQHFIDASRSLIAFVAFVLRFNVVCLEQQINK